MKKIFIRDPNTIYSYHWYKPSEIYKNKWFFGKSLRHIQSFFNAIARDKYYPSRRAKDKIRIYIEKGDYTNSVVHIKGQTLTDIINYIQKKK